MTWFRLLLRFLPADFRTARGEEILTYLEEGRHEAASRGIRGRISFNVAASLNLIATAVRLRLHPLPGRTPEADPGPGKRASLTDILRQDLTQAVRGVLGQPQIALLVALTLALGVGMNAAIFTVVDGVLLRPLAYEEPDRLVYVAAELTGVDLESAHFSAGDVRDIREAVSSFETVAEAAGIRQNLTGDGIVPQQITVGWTSAHLFETLGVTTVLGRPFDHADPPGSLLLTHELWQHRLGSDPDVIGRTIRLDGHPYSVLGVLPPGFELHVPGFEGAQVWKNPDDLWQNGGVWDAQGPNFGLFDVVARLAPDASLDVARAELGAVSDQLRKRFPEYDRFGLEITASRLHDRLTAPVRPGLLVLAGAAGLVLLIACANVTNLLMVRSQGRRKELVVRLALGSSRRRITRLVLLESLILALAGGAAGALVGLGATRVFQWMGPALPLGQRVEPDLSLLGFALAVSVGCALVVGLFPAVGAARSNAAEVLQGNRGALGGLTKVRRGLVVAQVALSLVLLIGAGLLTHSFVRLQRIDVGFDTEKLLTFSVTLPGTRYPRPVATDRFLRNLQERVEQLPGVSKSGTMWPMPLAGSLWQSEFRPGEDPENEPRLADYRVGTEEYFEVLGLPMREGRTFDAEDQGATVVVSTRTAETSWPGQSAVGKRLLANPWGGPMIPFEVVGVVDDVAYGNIRDQNVGALYFDTRAWSWNDWEFHVLARTEGDPASAVAAVQALLMELDPEVPVANPIPMDDLKGRQYATNRFALALIGVFSIIAGVLAAVGLYGLISYSVRSRRPELGVRIALGSDRGGIAKLVVGEGMRLAAWGIAMGIVSALALTRLLTSWLYGVEPSDAATYAVLSLAVGLVAMLAAGIPALRASRMEPAAVLRGD